MIQTWKYVYYLFILSEVFIFASLIIMMVISHRFSSVSSYEKVWMGSKILTVNQIMKKNNYEMYPILDINSYNERTYYNQNYENLLKHSKEPCENNYKKCGILDTLGNIMCIPENEQCPINEVIVDLISKNNEYISRDYKAIHLENLPNGYAIYYTNNAIDKEIITKLDFFDNPPKYISENNFIFDEETYKSEYYNTSEDDYDWYDDWHNSHDRYDDRLRTLDDVIYGDEEYTEKMKSYFEQEKNLDKSYKNIFQNLYVGNYIGFNDYSNMNKYMDIDLYYLYFHSFPNDTAYVFCIVCMIPIFITIIIALVLSCGKDNPFENNYINCCDIVHILIIIIIYSAIFIGYFVYFIHIYDKLYNKSNLGYITKIKADEFIDDLLSEIKERHQNVSYHLTVIILFSISLPLFLFSWILRIIIIYRNLKPPTIELKTETVYRRSG